MSDTPERFTVDTAVGVHGSDTRGGYWSSFRGGWGAHCARCGARITHGYVYVDLTYAPRHYCAEHVDVTYKRP